MNCLVATHCGIASYLPSLKGYQNSLLQATLAQGFQTCQFIVMWELLTHSQQNIQRKQRICLVYVMGASNLRLERGVQVC